MEGREPVPDRKRLRVRVGKGSEWKSLEDLLEKTFLLQGET